MTTSADRRRVLIFIVAYNAEYTIQNVLQRIPASLTAHDTHILVVDDSSRDETFARAVRQQADELPFPLAVLFNPVNQGYGGNQKIGFRYAIAHAFDVVALVHGIRYAFGVLKATVLSRAQDFGVLYERKFDLAPAHGSHRWYESKLDFDRPHSLALT